MIIYIAHCFEGKKENLEKAKKIAHDLATNDLCNCYVCPILNFSYWEYGEVGFDHELEACLDLLMCADRLIVASEISEGVRKEIDFAKLVKMEVLRLDENGELQPFTE